MPLLALCLMVPEGVTHGLNMGSRDTYMCQIKKNEGFVAWHLWDSWLGGWCLGTLFVVQVSVAAVKPRIMKQRNKDYRLQRERPQPHTHANSPLRTHSGQRHKHFRVVGEAIKVISCFQTWSSSFAGTSLPLLCRKSWKWGEMTFMANYTTCHM